MPITPFANFNPTAFEVVITCADGLENALLIELGRFGLMGTIVRMGRVSVCVSLDDFYHICLYSRVASRVLLPIGEYHFRQKVQIFNQVREVAGKKISRTIEQKTLDEDVPSALYTFASGYDWTTVFGVEHTFAIRLSTDKRLTVNQQFATLRIKDAIADCFNAKLGKRPSVDKSPDFHIYAHATTEFCELYLDLSGKSLHKRGYRVANTTAPLKENLASALLYECGWHTGKFDALIDPMCGSGTFVSEALLMYTDYPVGIDKKTGDFGFYRWKYHDETLWQTKSQHALTAFYDNLDKYHARPITVIATDASADAVHACHKNLLASALMPITKHISLHERPLSGLTATLSTLTATNPLIITNPPYGERLGEGDFIKPLYQGLGLMAVDGLWQAGIGTASMAVLASHVEEADTLPITNPHTLKCHNGALTVYFRHGTLDLSYQTSLIERFEKVDIQNEDSQELINRLHKNLTHLKKHAKKEQVSNLRIYDADLPNYNVAIDLYGNYIHVQEYAPPKQIPTEVAKARFNLVLSAIRQIFAVNRESIFIKTRMRQSGNDQYTKNPHANKKKKMWIVKEHGAYFYVNFSDYLDTGLFIDHRNMRQFIKQASRGKNVLNLFAYTCTASTHSALGGAKSVTSVDLSDNYLNWGKENFALNGLVLDAVNPDGTFKYQFVCADVFDWLKNHSKHYDVIFIDPPTFSNSKKFKGTFDVQRDHVALISRAMNRLAPDGVLYFSNNFTRFELDEGLKQRYQIVNMTDKTIGFDFNPKKPIHQSFAIRHKNSMGVIEDNPAQQSTTKMTSDKDKKPKLPNKTPPKTTKKPAVVNNNTKPAFIKPVSCEPSKPTQKVRYDKIDGKMVATVIEDTHEPNKDIPKRFRVKKPN